VRECLAYFLLEGQDPAVPLQYPTDYLLVPCQAPILKHLRGDERWRELYADAQAVIFVRADPAHADVHAGKLKRTLACPPLWFE